MANKQGTNDVVDSFIGDKLIEARYIGQTKYFDAFTDVSGALPLTYTSRASQVLKNYRMYGTASGSGVATENLFDKDAITPNCYIKSDGSIVTNSEIFSLSDYTPVNPSTVYTICTATGNAPGACWYDSNKTYISGFKYDSSPITNITQTSPEDAAYIRMSVRSSNPSVLDRFMLVEGSIVPASYIPYGYKIPLSVNTENLFDETYPGLGSTIKYLPIKVGVGSFTLTTTCPRTDNNAALLFFFAGNVSTGASTQTNGVWSGHPLTVQSSDGYVTIAYRILSSVSPADYSTRLTYDADHTLYIGSSKLSAEEYVDYADGKIYKMVEGVLTPTDPPSPLPAISAVQGENILSSTETVGTVTVKGRIKEIET